MANGSAVEVDKSEWSPEWYAIGTVEFAATGDRVLIVEDEFRSGYECEDCKGSGRVKCAECGGKGKRARYRHASEGDGAVVEFKCSTCDGKGEMVCNLCGGKGGLIVVPEVSQRRPTSGKIVSTGDKVKYFKTGENVLYSNFAGHAMDFERAGHKIVVRILHESELLSKVRGHLELRAVRNQKDSLGI